MVVKPRVSAFQNCAQRYMRHNIVRDIVLATKLVILWTGISVYTPIPVKPEEMIIDPEQHSWEKLPSSATNA